ncbi:MAG: hypothetical protein L3K17_03285 [Thermoplasmata archaeon]|nr:hypothetical protein [Thermoplasmata archaeon]
MTVSAPLPTSPNDPSGSASLPGPGGDPDSLVDGGLASRPWTSQATASVVGTSAGGFHHFARVLVRDAGFRAEGLDSGPWVRGRVGSPGREIYGFAGGERDVVRAPDATARARWIGISILVAGIVIVALVALLDVSGRGNTPLVEVALVPGLFLVAFGYFRLGGVESFDSDVVSIAYRGAAPHAVGQAIYATPMSLTVTIGGGRLRSYNARMAGRSGGFSGRLVRGIIPDRGNLGPVVQRIASRLAPGTVIPPEPTDEEESPFD